MSSIAAKLAAKSVWPMADRALRMAIGVSVTMLVARYLGPADFGALSFALSWTAFLGGLSWLGLGDALVRDLIRAPEERDRMLGTAVVLRALGSLGAALLAIGLFPVFYGEQPRAVAVLVWLFASASLFNETGGVPLLWSQAQADSRMIVLARLAPYLVAQSLRAALVFGGGALVWFAALGPLEAVLFATVSWAIHLRRVDRLGALRYDHATAKRLLQDALPILLTGVLATLALRLDQMMLAKFSSLDEVGFYAAATRFSEIWWGIPTIVMQIAGPLVLFGDHDDSRRNHRLAGLYAGLIAIASAAACATILLAPWGVPLLLGARYQAAVPVLTVHVLTAIIVFAEAPSYQEIVRRGLQRILLWKGTATLIANAALNLALIPRYGAMGAAVATVASYLIASILVPLLFPSVRDLLRMQLRAPLWLARYAMRSR